MSLENQQTILLVEDEALIAMGEKMALEGYGYKVITANSGEEATEAVENIPSIDLVLMDINLGAGRMDGPKAAEIILLKRDLPVVFLSSHIEPEIVEKTEKITSYGYVVKNTGSTILDTSIKMAFKLFDAKKKEKAKEEALRESEEHYHAMFEAESDAIVLIDNATGNILEANHAATALYGYDRTELLTKRNTDLSAEPAETQRVTLETPIISDRIVNIPLRFHRKKDGTVFPTEITGRFFVQEGRPVHIVAIRDITERKRVEVALRESLDRFQLVSLATYNAIWDWNLQTDTLWWNENFQTLFGYGAEEIEPGIESWTNRIHPKDRNRIKTSIRAAIDSGQENWFDQYRFRRKDGMYAEVEDRGYIARDASGQPARMISAMQDVTERKQAEALFQQERESFLDLINNQPAGIYRLRVFPREQWREDAWNNSEFSPYSLELVNDRFCEILGITRQFFETNPGFIIDLIHPEDKAEFARKNEEANTALIPFQWEVRLIIGGNIRWVHFESLPRPAANGDVLWMGILYDITERKQAEAKIKALLLEKEILLKEVHHRIKNNMATMMSLLSLQSKALKNPEAKASLLKAKERMMSMAVLYDKLYRSENLQEMSLSDYLPRLIDEIVGIFPNKDIVKIEKKIDDIVLGVKVLSPLGIIVNELLTNALKHAFTGKEDGTIGVFASVKNDHVTLVVEDNGVGIPESIDMNNTSGMGLELVSMLTAQIDGTIRIDRRRGARFVLEFDAR
jgi:PAS domain S-box-containing protein